MLDKTRFYIQIPAVCDQISNQCKDPQIIQRKGSVMMFDQNIFRGGISELLISVYSLCGIQKREGRTY